MSSEPVFGEEMPGPPGAALAFAAKSVFLSPGDALRRIARDQPLAAVAGAYGVVHVVGYIVGAAEWSKAGEVLGKFLPSRFSDPWLVKGVFFAFAAAGDVMRAFLVHLMGRLFGGGAGFRPFLAAFLFVGVVTGFFQSLAPPPVAKAALLVLSLWGFFLHVVAVRAVHEVSALRAFGACLLGQILQGLLIFAFSMAFVVPAVMKGRLRLPAGAPAPLEALPPSPAPYDWTVRTLGGADVPMDSLRGKTVVLNFWATWCGPCKAEMPSLQKLHDKMKDESVAVVAVSDEDPDTVRKFAEKEGYSLPFYVLSGPRPEAFSAPGIPATFVLSPQGQVVSKHVGYRVWDDEATIQALKNVRDGKTVAVAAAK